MTQANAYSDLVSVMPWLPDHMDALKAPATIEVSLLDVLLIDLAASTAVTWAHDFNMPSVMDRLSEIQADLRTKLTDAGLPYRRQHGDSQEPT